MTEKQLVINNRTISYKGIFKVEELFNVIHHSLDQLSYEKREKKTEETVSLKGKKTYIELRPFKERTSYAALMIKIKITLDKVTEVIKEVDGIKTNFQQGDVNISFDSWVLTDYVDSWGMEPVFYFLKSMINKYVYHFPISGNFFGEIKADTNYLTQQIKALLNLYKYKVQENIPPPTVEDPEEEHQKVKPSNNEQ